MEKTLLILEVSRKQEYIFASKRLRENAARSGDVRYVTSSAFFSEAAGDLYRPEDHLVYAGGGHAVLQFQDREAAAAFARAVTETALRRYDGLELFAKQRPYDEGRSPWENLEALRGDLERKKSIRRASFRRVSFGVERLDTGVREPEGRNGMGLACAEGWRFSTEVDELAGGDPFVAVAHIDGNAMGRRMGELCRCHPDWESCRQALDRFSRGIQADFERAFSDMLDAVIRWKGASLVSDVLPVRPVILAGDDVCFVSAGSIGLECARIFLERLAAVQPAFGPPYAACAGVALVHRKFPFFQSYALAEELCGSAKRFSTALDPAGSVSAMDWHIEFGQLKSGLEAVREDYRTEDGGRMELRPVAVTAPAGGPGGGVRSYAFFRKVCQAVQQERGRTGRGKIKDLRGALKQGELETRFFLRSEQIGHLLDFVPGGRAFQDLPEPGGGCLRRCLLFDAVEMAEHCQWEGGAG